jgi:predicted outer membrane repeat protein
MLNKIIIRIVCITIALLMVALPPVAARGLAVPAALTFTVDSTLDQPDDLTMPGTCHTAANTCTLRAAVMQANRTTGVGATIMLPSGIYPLTILASGANGEENSDLNLTTPASADPVITIIIGAGAGSTIIEAPQLDRVFHVHPGRVAAISQVTIRNGYVAGINTSGGGIYNEGSLTVSSVTISANQAGNYGGGIYNNESGNLTVINSTIRQNYADWAGGGIYNSGFLYVLNSTLSENTARAYGGGISNAGRTTVSKSTIHGNGSYYNGGGISTGGGAPNLYVINSTISQNYAYNNGGGIYASFLSILAAVYNTTIIDNDADHDRDVNGGIGGGVYADAGSRLIVVNTLIAGNTVLNAPIYNDCDGMLEVYGWNLLSDVTGCTFSGNGYASWGGISLNKTGPLQNNGGPTWTHAILASSAAIDSTIDSLGCVDETGLLLTTDQRGAPRPAGARCDVGAFEYSPLRYVYLPLTLR